MGYVGQNMCQIHLWCIWHRCPSIAHLVPQSGSPTLLRCQINSRNEKTLAWERERTEAIKKHLFGRVRGWCSWFDWFVYTCGSVCTAVPTLSHRESGVKIFWFDIDAYYVEIFLRNMASATQWKATNAQALHVLLGKWEERERNREGVKKYH